MSACVALSFLFRHVVLAVPSCQTIVERGDIVLHIEGVWGLAQDFRRGCQRQCRCPSLLVPAVMMWTDGRYMYYLYQL